MAALAAADLALEENISAALIEIVLVEEARWTTRALDCRRSGSASGGTIPGFRVLLLARDTIFEYHTDDTEVRLCGRTPVLEAEPEILLLIDPVAAELVALAQRRLGQQLDLSTRRVQLVEVRPVTWQDSSLGCPVEGQSYTEVVVNGYRIVLMVGDNTYVFHGTFERIVQCEE